MRVIAGGDVALADKLTYRFKDGAKYLAATFENGLQILGDDKAWDGKLRLNILTQVVEVLDPPWDVVRGTYEQITPGLWRPWQESDYDYCRAWFRLDARWKVDFKDTQIIGIVRAAAEENRHHPIQEWLGTLRWDGVGRLDTWLGTVFGCEQGPYTQRVGRWFLISMVARAMAPGCQVDHIPVLEGPQGYGKSTALRELVGEAWYSDTHLSIGDKDAYQALEGKWLIEIAELASIRSKDMDRVKTFLTERVSKYRPPYARVEVMVPRGCVFVGTTNDSAYLTDSTGNRRFWPVRVPRPVPPGAVAALRDQLFAEALEAYQAGDRWHPTTDESRDILQHEQDTRRVSDPWEQPVTLHLAGRARVTLPDLLRDALDIEPGRHEIASMHRIARILTAMGWRQHRTRLERFWAPDGSPDALDAPPAPAAPANSARRGVTVDDTGTVIQGHLLTSDDY